MTKGQADRYNRLNDDILNTVRDLRIAAQRADRARSAVGMLLTGLSDVPWAVGEEAVKTALDGLEVGARELRRCADVALRIFEKPAPDA